MFSVIGYILYALLLVWSGVLIVHDHREHSAGTVKNPSRLERLWVRYLNRKNDLGYWLFLRFGLKQSERIHGPYWLFYVPLFPWVCLKSRMLGIHELMGGGYKLDGVYIARNMLLRWRIVDPSHWFRPVQKMGGETVFESRLDNPWIPFDPKDERTWPEDDYATGQTFWLLSVVESAYGKSYVLPALFSHGKGIWYRLDTNAPILLGYKILGYQRPPDPIEHHPRLIPPYEG